jgi:adenylylsulfate kinase-like enzyme
MKKIKLDKKKGTLFWITGLSGSGKTSLAKLIKKKIIKQYGPTILFSGDDLRKIFKFDKYDKKSRLIYSLRYSDICKKITNQKINVILAVVGMFDKVRLHNKKNIKNYIEIYLKSDLKKIIKNKKKKIYNTEKKNIVGIDIKPELPKNPNITLINSFSNNLNSISNKLINILVKNITFK